MIYLFKSLRFSFVLLISIFSYNAFSQVESQIDNQLKEIEQNSHNVNQQGFVGDGEVFYNVSRPPKPKVSMTQFYHNVNEYVKENYPDNVKSFGRVYVEFVVEKDGELTNFKVVDGLDEKVNEVVIDAVKFTGSWYPAQNGVVNVRSYQKQPIMVDEELIQKK